MISVFDETEGNAPPTLFYDLVRYVDYLNKSWPVDALIVLGYSDRDILGSYSPSSKRILVNWRCLQSKIFMLELVIYHEWAHALNHQYDFYQRTKLRSELAQYVKKEPDESWPEAIYRVTGRENALKNESEAFAEMFSFYHTRRLNAYH